MDWQPIETAPKDGRWVLLGRVGIHSMHTAFWRGGVWSWGGMQYFNNPTHWMPLPPPPANDAAHERQDSPSPTQMNQEPR